MHWFVVFGIIVVGAVGLAFLVKSRSSGVSKSGMHITSVLHVNVNCSNFDRSRQFYEMLGFRVLMHVEPNGPPEVAAAVGMPSYVVRGALLAHRDGTVIDLLEWQDPRDGQPPYKKLNHLGLGRIAFSTTNIDADMQRLQQEGVGFLSEQPAGVKDPLGGTTRFICFKDPDGTVLELVQMGTIMGMLQRASQLAAKQT